MKRSERLQRVDQLASALFDGILDDGGRRELNDLLRGDPDSCERYLELADAHSALLHDHAGDDLAPPLPPLSEFRTSSRRLPARKIAIVLAAAAALALLFGNATMWFRFLGESEEPTASSDWVAVASRTVEAEWNTSPLSDGDPLAPGRISLSSGLVQIEFFSGATLVAEGPAELNLVSPWEVDCLSGRLRAFVPEPARGFVVTTPKYRAVDLGTEFSLDVGPDGESELHVVEGEVRIDEEPDQLGRTLLAGDGIRTDESGIESVPGNGDSFVDRERLLDLAEADERTRFAAWSSSMDRLRSDPTLLTLFDFEEQKRWDRHLANRSEPSSDGAIIGARWTEGRWPGKKSLEFKRITDRVRIDIPGEFDQLTLLARIRVEGLYQWLNSILLTDGFDEGEVHWQISDEGELIAGISTPGRKPNTTSPPVIGPDDLGRWIQLALTIDRNTGRVIHYLDGEPVIRDLRKNLSPLRIGKAEIGNWTAQGGSHPIRSLNGRIDEFAVLSRALSDEEIRNHYEAGR